jgi:ubiquinone biosynthesis protein
MQALDGTQTTRTGRARRYAEVGAILVRSGVVHRSRARSARKQAALGRSLRVAFERAGGVYVKLGQLLSTRPDLVPAVIATELSGLQSGVAPVPSRLVRSLVADELGAPLHRIFRDFDDRPVAAASIAQVHRATLRDGRPVAVKVQRPEVAGRVRRDVDILVHLAERLERLEGSRIGHGCFLGGSRRREVERRGISALGAFGAGPLGRLTRWGADQRLADTMRGFAGSLLGELDFTAEAGNLTALRRAVAQHDGVVVPAPMPMLTRRRVLVMDWIDGRPLAEAAGSLPAGERARLARALLGSFLDQIFVAGTFHVDPHPGNVHLTTAGDIALLDCGAIGRLDVRQRSALQALLLAVVMRDGAAMREALLGLSVSARDDRGLGPALDRLLDRHLPPGARPDAALFGAFMAIVRDAGLALEPTVYGAFRAVATVQATLIVLAPAMDLVAEASGYGNVLAAA